MHRKNLRVSLFIIGSDANKDKVLEIFTGTRSCYRDLLNPLGFELKNVAIGDCTFTISPSCIDKIVKDKEHCWHKSSKIRLLLCGIDDYQLLQKQVATVQDSRPSDNVTDLCVVIKDNRFFLGWDTIQQGESKDKKTFTVQFNCADYPSNKCLETEIFEFAFTKFLEWKFRPQPPVTSPKPIVPWYKISKTTIKKYTFYVSLIAVCTTFYFNPSLGIFSLLLLLLIRQNKTFT